MVQENADQIWRFQRYRLVFEYVQVKNLPPPMNIPSYIFTFIKKHCCTEKNSDRRHSRIDQNCKISLDSVFSGDSK